MAVVDDGSVDNPPSHAPPLGPEIVPTRLNPTDATLWDIERNPTLRTTIVAVLVLDRPVSRTRLVDLLEAASRRVPRLRQRVVGNAAGVGAPHWELDPDFAIERHVSFVAAHPVDDAAIVAVAEPLASTPLDRTRPLWECVYVGGRTGRAALVLKVHHSLTDGVGGIGLLDAMLDRERDAPARDLDAIPVPRAGRRIEATTDELDEAVRRAVALPFQLSSAAVTTAFHPVRTAARSWRGARSAGRLLAPSSAPLSPLMTERSMERATGMCELDLERLHRAAAIHGCTINHAFFAGAIGAIAAYHRELRSPTDGLRVTMPVSFRRSDHAAAGNQWAPVRFVVPTAIDDPVERMLAMRALVATSRREPALGFSQSLAGLVQVLPSALSSGIVGGMMRGVDVALTNVPGLVEPHFLGGAAVSRIFAFAPTGGAALNIALVSHLGRACVGTLSDTAAVSDPPLLHELMAAGLDEVVAAAEKTEPTARATDAADDRPTSDARPGAPPERLSTLDAAFLRLETLETPMHIGGIFVIEGGRLRDEVGRIRLDAARRHVQARLRRLPRFTRRLAEVPLGLGRPVWVDDPGFDIRRHVKQTVVQQPGGRQDLLDRCAELYREPLDRAHPLWELWLVDGLADGSVAIVEKIHHALIDGVSGVEMASAIFDPAPDTADEEPYEPPRSRGPGQARLLADALLAQVADPLQVARHALASLRSSPDELARQAGSTAVAATDLVRPEARARRAPFNQPIGRSRELRVVTFDRAAIDRVRAPRGATVNDVVLATVAGAMRRWFAAAAEPPVDVHVLVPVNTRHDTMAGEPGNHVGGVLVALPVGEPDPGRRLQLVEQRMRHLKEVHEGEGLAHLLGALDHVPAITHAALTRLVTVQPLVNLVVTNVPGPRAPLHFLGGRITEMIPVVPLGPRLGVGIAVLSYVDRLAISLFADPDACADLDVLADALREELDALTEAALV